MLNFGSKKYVAYTSFILVTLLVVVFMFWRSETPSSIVFGHKITVKDVVTNKPISNVQLELSFAGYCHPEDVIKGGYNYSTCDGRFEPIGPVTTNNQGQANIRLNPSKHPPANAIRFGILKADGYLPTRSYSLTQNDPVWLVPNDAPLPSKVTAIDYLKTQPPIQNLLSFYKSNNIEWEYLYAEKEAWYGVWRVTLNLSGDIIRNRDITILVHPGTKEYVVCNPIYNRTTGTTEARFKEMQKEHEFISSLDVSHEHEFGHGGCSPDLLINS